MATKTLSVSASISITANGTSRVNGTLTWTKPTLPSGAMVTGISVSGTYTWSGRGSFTLTINGSTISSGSNFNVNLPISATSPYTITGVGGNRNSTGASCNFTNLIITYTYDDGVTKQLSMKKNGIWTPVQDVYKKINGNWIKQTEYEFDENTNYFKQE